MSALPSSNALASAAPSLPLRGRSKYTVMFKTKLCDFYSSGRCRLGTRCTFAHSTHELKEAPSLEGTNHNRFAKLGARRPAPQYNFARIADELHMTSSGPSPTSQRAGTNDGASTMLPSGAVSQDFILSSPEVRLVSMALALSLAEALECKIFRVSF